MEGYGLLQIGRHGAISQDQSVEKRSVRGEDVLKEKLSVRPSVRLSGLLKTLELRANLLYNYGRPNLDVVSRRPNYIRPSIEDFISK